VVDWHRSPVTVSATASDCRSTPEPDGLNSDTCDLQWSRHAIVYEQNRETDGLYKSGAQVAIHIDPKTGTPEDHDVAEIVAVLAVAIALLAASLRCWTGTASYWWGSRPHSPRRWLKRLMTG
jgi:hypothetical protein